MDQVAILFLASLLAFAFSQHVEHPDGRSDHYHTQDDGGNFNFGYDTARSDGSRDSRTERGDGYGNVVGSYSLLDPDGRSRVVDYTAGENGFQAVVRTNEPGTANQSPAFVSINADPPRTGYGVGRQQGPITITRPTTHYTRRQYTRPAYRPYRSTHYNYDPYSHNTHNTHGYADYSQSYYNYDRPYYNYDRPYYY